MEDGQPLKHSFKKRERSRRWLEAAIALSNNPYAAVSCPECRDCHLSVHDDWSREDPIHFDRYLICRGCGSWNMLRMRRDDEEE